MYDVAVFSSTSSWPVVSFETDTHFGLLVGALEHLDYFSHHIGNVIIVQLTKSIIFQRGRAQPPTR